MKRKFNFFEYVKKRTLVLLVISILLLSMAISTTIAYIVTKTDTQSSSFIPPIVKVQLDAHDNITNKGNIPVYVRALAVVNWASKDDEHTISSEVPKVGVDFNIDFETEGWFQAEDGFFYYSKPLGPGESINLIVSAEQITDKIGYEFRLQLLSGTIQADPITAVEEAWPAVEVAQVDGINVLVERNPDSAS